MNNYNSCSNYMTKNHFLLHCIEKFLDREMAIDILQAAFERYQTHYGALHKYFFGGK